MQHVRTLLARELAAYFLGPIAYLVLLAFQLIAAFNFYDLVDLLSAPRSELSSLRDPMNAYIANSAAFWIAIMVSIPLLTMRLFAEERRQGTIEALLTVPVTETEVVVAKWLAGVIMYCVLLVPFFMYLPFLHFQAKYDFDLGPLMSLSVGLVTLGMMFVSIGLFLSALTRNQIIAAIWTFVVLLVLVVFFAIAYVFAAQMHYNWADGLRFVAVLFQTQSFGQGLLDFRYIAVQLSVCFFMLSLTVRVLEARSNR
jgi:gliding motility-associated transport system permease protein